MLQRTGSSSIAVEGTPFEGVSDLLTGPTTLTYHQEDPVGPAKALIDYVKSNPKVEIVGGAMDGKMLDAAGVEQLSKLPGKGELRAKIAGLLKAPGGKIGSVLKSCTGKGYWRYQGLRRQTQRRSVSTAFLIDGQGRSRPGFNKTNLPALANCQAI